MKIERMNTYNDQRFRQEILNQHGAFLIDHQYICEIEIINEQDAKIFYHDYSYVDEIIDAFRYYSEHITRFYDNQGNLIKQFDQVQIFDIPICDIQPSQLYVDEKKCQAVESFITSSNDIIVPLISKQRFIMVDGHTRAFVAMQRGYQVIRGYVVDEEEWMMKITDEVIKRGVRNIGDIKMLGHEDYKERWLGFCQSVGRKENGNSEFL